jgi:hypothetical protein
MTMVASVAKHKASSELHVHEEEKVSFVNLRAFVVIALPRGVK